MLPVRLCIPSQSHSFAEVSFGPQTIRQHKAVFEAVVEGGARSVFVCVCACVHVCVCVCVRAKYNELYMNKYILIREQSFNNIIVHYLFNFYTFFHTFGLGEHSTLFLVSPSLSRSLGWGLLQYDCHGEEQSLALQPVGRGQPAQRVCDPAGPAGQPRKPRTAVPPAAGRAAVRAPLGAEERWQHGGSGKASGRISLCLD